MITFNIVPGAELSGEVFPPEVQSRDWVGFHGTASAYSGRIEREGFMRANGPIDDADIDLVTSLAAEHGVDPEQRVAGFKSLNSISFSSSPLVALAYAQHGQSGGQGVGFVLGVAHALIYQHGESLSDENQRGLKSIIANIELVRQSQPVIYAFDLQGLQLTRFQSLTAAVHVYEDVPPTRIVAKALVPDGINHAAIDARSIRDQIRTAYAMRNGHWICNVQQ
jgi:hypothetical protein